jgi:hypothetical protein
MPPYQPSRRHRRHLQRHSCIVMRKRIGHALPPSEFHRMSDQPRSSCRRVPRFPRREISPRQFHAYFALADLLAKRGLAALRNFDARPTTPMNTRRVRLRRRADAVMTIRRCQGTDRRPAIGGQAEHAVAERIGGRDPDSPSEELLAHVGCLRSSRCLVDDADTWPTMRCRRPGSRRRVGRPTVARIKDRQSSS